MSTKIVYKPLSSKATVWYDGKRRLNHYMPIGFDEAKQMASKGYDVRYINDGRPTWDALALDKESAKMLATGTYDNIKDKIQFYLVTVIRVVEKKEE